MEKLFTDFPKISTQEWKELINKDIKGVSFDKKLVWKTIEGLNIEPFYTIDDLKETNFLENKIGEFPFGRGNKTKSNDWLVVQDIIVKDIEKANKKALNILEKGVDAVKFVFEKEFNLEKNQFSQLLAGIDLENTEINFSAESKIEDCPTLLIDEAKKQNIESSEIKGSISYDPLSKAVLTGNLNKWDKKKFLQVLEFANILPNFGLININILNFANAGATAVQQLAFAISIASEYMTCITDNNYRVAKNIRFSYAVGSSYFIEIAKFRASRYLWSKIIEAFVPDDLNLAKTKIYATTFRSNKTIYDPHVNMLRTTTEAMSAIIGGVDALTIEPYDAVFANANEFSERVARNQQIILRDEAYLDKVVDISAGSFYIENLTASLIEAAWSLFLEIEEKGGYIKCLESNFIQTLIADTNKKRDFLIATGRQSILGTNIYPNQNEKVDNIEPLLNINNKEQHDFEAIKMYRGAEVFEKLRQKTLQANKTYKVFLLTYGNPVMRKARADFSENFYAVAGFKIINNTGFETIEQGIEESIKQDADIVVLCSSDDSYVEMCEVINKSAINKIIVVAGYPKNAKQLEQLGIENFIHVKSNLLEELQQIQNKLITE